MKSIIQYLTLLINFAFSDCLQMYLAHHYQENDGTVFDIEEYIFGEDNCCDEYPISFCSEGTTFYEKEDYADVTDSENWDVISESVALVRGNSQMLYNPIEENSYNYGISPINTVWKAGPTYGQNSSYIEGAGVLAIFYVPKFLPGTIGSFYSYPDDQYYDIHFTSWTSGNGNGWPGGGGDGSGGGAGGGVAYWRSGTVDGSPKIIEVSDVPGDQGGRVYIYFTRSLIDVDAHPSSLNLYSIKRLDDGNWVNIGSFGAQGNVQYIFEATTLLDSTHQNSGITGFKILGQSFGVSGYMFESEIEYGYSIDNIAPGVPEGLNVTLENSQAVISWLPSIDADFQYYSLEKDTDETFQNAQSFNITQNNFTDSDIEDGIVYFYRIRAADYSGNWSDFSEVVQLTTLSNDNINVAKRFMLYQNYPNPFNPITNLRYDLPENIFVNITVYDISGNMVKNLINTNQSSGYKSVIWDATNNQGQRVSAGVYIYSIEAGDFRQIKKMILLK